LPAVSRAREQSNRTACMSNLRMLGAAMIMYANDFSGRLPNTNPPLTASSSTETNYVLVALNQTYVKSAGAFHCPSNDGPVQKDITSADYYAADSARQCYDFYSVFWLPENGPKLVRVASAPLAWDLNVNPTQQRETGQNHGPKGGNVVYGDGHADWQDAKVWDGDNWPHPAESIYKSQGN